MIEFGIKPKNADLSKIGLGNVETVYWNLSPAELVEESIIRGMGVLADTGALAVDTGEFTGRSPKDKFIVKDETTEKHRMVEWFLIYLLKKRNLTCLKTGLLPTLQEETFFVRDVYACADKRYAMNIRVVNEYPWSNQFVYNMFLRPSTEELQNFEPEWDYYKRPRI
jgi:phosphoenolpyruvate carboxykinase (ATP)